MSSKICLCVAVSWCANFFEAVAGLNEEGGVRGHFKPVLQQHFQASFWRQYRPDHTPGFHKHGGFRAMSYHGKISVRIDSDRHGVRWRATNSAIRSNIGLSESL